MVKILDNFTNDFFEGINNACITINVIWIRFFIIMKYGLIGMLILIGLLSLFRFRGAYKGIRIDQLKDYESDKKFAEKVMKTHIFLCVIYFFLGLGILIGFLTRLLIFLIAPYERILILDLINFSGVIPQKYIEGVSSYDNAKTPMEKTIFYGIAFFSFTGLVNMLLGLRFMILYANKSHTTSFRLFLTGATTCILCGFTTFMPIFLRI